MPSCAHVFGTQPPPSGIPHAFGTPPPPQVWGQTQEPQGAVTPPHPSACAPQEFGYAAHVFGVHGTPGHVPQFAVSPPQPLLWTPQAPG